MKTPEQLDQMLNELYWDVERGKIVNGTEKLRALQSESWKQGMLDAALSVEKLAALFVGNTKTDGTRDAAVYDQGIGCERAGKMLRELTKLTQQKTNS